MAGEPRSRSVVRDGDGRAHARQVGAQGGAAIVGQRCADPPGLRGIPRRLHGLRAVRLGVLTGGGDCPGLNAAIRAIVRKGIDHYGHAIVGFRDGWWGPLENQHEELTIESIVAPHVRRSPR